MEEAVTAWPGPPRERWWTWVVESGRSLGLKCRVVDGTFDQLCEVARQGGRIIVPVGPDGHWRAIAAVRGQRYQLFEPVTDASQRWVGVHELRRSLGSPGAGVPLRSVVIEPHLSGTLEGEDGAVHRTPLSRAWALLRPEGADIWVILVFALVSGLLALATPLAIEALVSTVTFGRLLQPIVILALMLLVFLAFQAAIRALQTYIVEIIQRRLFARVAADLAYRLPRVGYESLYGKSGRELVNRFFDVITVQKVTAQLLLDGVSVVLNTLIGMMVLGFYHPWLLGFDVVLLALIAFGVFVLGRGAIQTSIKESKAKYHMAAWLEDLAGCVVAFRYDGAAEFALEQTDRLANEYLTARRKHFRILMRQIVFALALQAVASTVLLGLGGWLVVAGQLTLGQLVAAELIVTVIVSSFAKLGKHMESYYDLMASVDKLGVLFDLPVEKQDGLLSGLGTQPAEVLLDRVTCQDPDGHPVLKEVTLRIRSRERAVITGASRSGKSLLLDLLFGLRRPTSGIVAINGADPRDFRPDILRRHVALVRDIEVFEGSISENVHLERHDLSTNDVREALRDVGLLDEILALPHGLETELTATGCPLTPNQLRRLMLARGVVGQPVLLLVDGVLDALPDADAARVYQTLSDPGRSWTLILVTGRELLAEAATSRWNLSVIIPAASLGERFPARFEQRTEHAH